MAVGCLIVVAVIEAYQQALSGAPKASANLPHLDGMWNFVPLGLLIIGGVFWVIGRIPKHNRPSTHLPASPTLSVFTPISGKVMSNLSPAELTRLYKDHTTLDADKLAEPYIGTWMSVSGTVYNVSVGFKGPRVHLDGVTGVSLIHCQFGTESGQQASMYKKGNSVNINGKISDINPDSVSLEECDFA